MSYRSYFLMVMVALSTCNQLDRQLAGILLEPIRQEFDLRDIQLGILSGPVFAIFHAAATIPAVVWAVRHGPRNLIAVAAMIWGAMTVLSGFATSFALLLIGRAGIALGEASSTPAAQAMISDSYPAKERSGAQAMWVAGINLGSFAAFLIGGIVGQRYGWRAAFVGSGIATIAIGILIRFTIRTPTRPVDDESVRLRAAPSTILLSETLRYLWRDPVIRLLVLASMAMTTLGQGTLTFVASFLIRSHGMSLQSIGIFLSIVIGIGGALVVVLTGRLIDRVAGQNERHRLMMIGLFYLATTPFSVGFYLVGDTTVALSLFAVSAVGGAVFIGPVIAILHGHMPPAARPAASALFFMIVGLFGLGVGPLLTGLLSDGVFANHGAESLRFALATLQAAGLIGAVLFLVASRLATQR